MAIGKHGIRPPHGILDLGDCLPEVSGCGNGVRVRLDKAQLAEDLALRLAVGRFLECAP